MQPFIRTISLQLLAAELFSATFLFFHRMKKRRHWAARLIGCLCLILLISFGVVKLKDFLLSPIETSDFNTRFFLITYLSTVISELAVFFSYLLSMKLVFSVSRDQAVFIGCASYATRNIARCVFSLYLLVFGPVPTFSTSVLIENGMLLPFLLVYALVYVICYFVFFQRYESGDEEFLNRKILAVLLILIVVNAGLSAVNAPKNSSEASALYAFILISRVLLCLMGLIMQFFVLDWVKLRFQQSQMEHLIDTQKAQYEIAKKSIDTVNLNAHDLRHQIALITSAIRESGNAGAIESELDEMKRMIETVDTAYRTGNKALDATLTEKARVCRMKEIHFSAIADGTAVSFMSDVDIYTLFGNALDNAIEAAEHIAEPEGRVISLQLRRLQGMTSVHVENTFAQAPQFSNGFPQTQKHDKEFHGFGVKSIARVTEKYGGNLKMHIANELFCLDVILPSR